MDVIKNYSNYRPSAKDKLMWSANKIFQKQLESEGLQVEIDGIEKTLIVRNHGNPTNEFKEERYVISGKDIDINRGSILKYDNEFYIVITDIDKDNPIYNTSKMQRCNHLLRWVGFDGKIQSCWAITENKTLYTSGVTEDKLIRIQDMVERIVIPYNEYTKYIDVDYRFQINRNFWRVTKIDEDRKGIVELMCEQDMYNSATDNKELGIADYYSKSHTYKLEILNKNPILLSLDDAVTLQIKAYDNDKLVENPELKFDVKDESICKVENNNIIPLRCGTTTISIYYENVSESVDINVIEQEIKNYTIDIQGNNSIKWGLQSNYKAIFKVDGVEYENTCKFELTDKNGLNTNLATIISQDNLNNTCTIKANSDRKSGIVLLHCTDSTGLHEVKEIKIKSIYG